MARMISRQEAAELLDCNVQTVTNWVERGLLKGHTIGRALMVDRESIEQYFDDLKELGGMARQIADMKKEYQSIIRSYKEVLNEARGSFITPVRAREAFRANQMALLSLCEGYLRKREREAFSGIIRDENLDYLSASMGLTRERIIQIAILAANKLSNIKELKQIHERNVALEAENEQLRKMLSESDKRLKEYGGISKLAVTLFDKQLSEFNLSVRTLNGLRGKNCHTIADLVKLDREELVKARNLGKKSIMEIDEFVSSLGLHWRMDPDLMTSEELKKWNLE